MLFPSQNRTKLHSYAVAICICVFAFGAALLNGMYRGHWFQFGIFADAIVCLSMVGLFLREKRRFK